MLRNKGYKTHIGLVTHQSNYCNIVSEKRFTAPNIDDHWAEVVTGWEWSIAVHTKITGQPIFLPKNLKFYFKIYTFSLYFHLSTSWVINLKIIQPLVLMLTQKQIHSVCFKLLKILFILPQPWYIS